MPVRALSSGPDLLGVTAVALAGTVVLSLGAYVLLGGPSERPAAQSAHVAAPVASPSGPPSATSATSTAPTAQLGASVPSGVLLSEHVTTGLRPVVGALSTVVPGRQSWVRIPWTTDTPVCSVAVTVSAAGASVGYPLATKAYASFYREDRLRPAASDYTAVRVLVPAFSVATSVTADVTASYTSTAKASNGVPPKGCAGTPVTRTYRVTLPVSSLSAAPASGPAGAAEALSAPGTAGVAGARSAG